MPDRNRIGLPSFIWTDRCGPNRHLRHITSARCASVLNYGHWVKIGDARFELQVLARRRRLVFPLAFAFWWIIECPVFHFALPALHDGAANFVVSLRIRIEFDWKVNILGRHSQFGPDTVEAELHIGLRKRERMLHGYRFAVL